MMRWLLFILLLLIGGGDVPAQGLFTNIAVKPGPSAAVYSAQPYYTCNTNRYVAPTGSSSNNGLTTSTPWDIATAIAYAAPNGTCINAAAGIYDVSSNQIVFSHGGSGVSKTGYVVWRCSVMPFSFSGGVLQGEGAGCVIKNVSGTPNFMVSWASNTAWMMLDGFEVNGGSGNAHTCIASNLDTTVHHLWILNTDTHDCGLVGIAFNQTNWLFVIHNVAHDNAYTDGNFGSGISIFEPVQIPSYSSSRGNPDYWHSTTTGLTYDLVVNYNVTYHNYNGLTGSTDGNGIILDDFQHIQAACPGVGTCPWAGASLTMGNVMYNNGGAGIKHQNSTNSGNQTIVNNTAYADFWDFTDTGIYRGDFFLDPGINNFVFNNIAYAVGFCTPCGIANQPFVGQNCGGLCTNSGNVWQTNLSYPGGLNGFDNTQDTYPTVGTNHNLDGSDPKFVNTSTSNPNFALQAGSPAVGFGQAFDLWQSSGAVDVGACGSTLTICP
jgi:hypothetical protein